MKTIPALSASLKQIITGAIMAVAMLCLGSSAFAQTYLWTGTTDTSWQTASNWFTPPGAPTSGITLSGSSRISVANGTGSQLIYTAAEGTTLVSGSGIRGLAIGVSNVNGQMTITGGTFSTLNGNTADFLGQGSTGVLNINGGTYLSSSQGLVVGFSGSTGSGTFTVTSGSASMGTLLIGGAATAGLTGTVNLDGGTLKTTGTIGTASTLATSTFNFNGGTLQVGSASVTFAGLTNAFVKSGGAVIDTNGNSVTFAQNLLTDVVSTGGGLTKSGSGTLTLSGTNTYTGDTTINLGTLAIGGTGQLGAGSYAGNIANAGTFTYKSAASQTLSGVISGTGALTTASPGALTLSGTSTYTGSTTTGAGSTLTIGGAGQLGSTGTYAGAITNSGTFNYNSSATQTLSGNFAAATGALNVKTGSGTLTLAGDNHSYTGVITVESGATLVSSNVAGLAAATSDTINGTLIVNASMGATTQFSNLIGSGTITTNNGTTVGLRWSPTGNVTFAGSIQDGSGASKLSLSKGGAGTLFLTGTSTFTGGIGMSAGGLLVVSQLSDTGPSSIGPLANGITTFAAGAGFGFNGSTSGSTSRSFAGIGNSTGGTLTLDASGTVPSATLTLGEATLQPGNGSASTPTTWTLQGSNTGANTISGAIKNPTTVGVSAVAKNGAGTWVLSGTSNYTGATTVTGGMLIVSGSLTGTTSASVSAGAELRVNGLVNTAASLSVSGTLSGAGTVGTVTVASGGVVTPGSLGTGNTGILTSGTFNQASGAHLSMEINGTTAGTSADQLITTANAALTLAGDLKLIIGAGYVPAGSDTLLLILNNGTGAVSGQFASVNGLFVTDNNGQTNVGYSGDAGTLITLNGQQFSLSYTAGNGNDVALLAVPEPGTWAMLLSGIGMLSFWQRARRRA